jgi:hypothetical protein
VSEEGGGRGGYGFRSVISVQVSYTVKYISLTDVGRLCVRLASDNRYTCVHEEERSLFIVKR